MLAQALIDRRNDFVETNVSARASAFIPPARRIIFRHTGAVEILSRLGAT
jgi:hypothetical protein